MNNEQESAPRNPAVTDGDLAHAYDEPENIRKLLSELAKRIRQMECRLDSLMRKST